ncbi:alpha/beta hydrolase [Novipirellula artificiosorum]|uniref:Alpha/beta hydrolase family protein n=1 Tax=Novipirellula artificiosorum TaxID=2528016 RepID=A0A5C6E0D6_9BACT|nr:alpha/beta fold hydrolase [Novipirellula artificiosorum]TWU42342.1 Alpha/beta hydrolase family protein [Novipirellula artificiosorum]
MNRQRIRQLLFVVCAISGIAFAGTVWFVAGALVAPSNHAVGPPPSGYRIESTTIPSGSGSSLAAWFVPCENATATVILLHPIRGDRRSMLGRAMLLHDVGYATLLIDLQGHGESLGDNITAGYRERLDAVAAVAFARSRNPNHRIGLIGCSLGGAAALLASPLDLDALVLESVYPTISEAVHNRVSMRLGALSYFLTPALLVQLNPRLGVLPSQLRPIDHIENAGCPILVAGGDCDAHTTLSETQRLFDAAREPKQLVVFEGVAHNDLLTANREKYQEIVAFLNAHLRIKGMEHKRTQ